MLNKKYGNPILELVPKDLLLTRARYLDQISTSQQGPLHCIVFAIKDNIQTSYEKYRLQTTAGSIALIKAGLSKSNEDAPVITSIVDAGAIIIGKANMDEFALGLRTFSSRGGQTLNPHDTKRFPGGSSGGSAVAISLGMVDASLATDTGGSIRIPASLVGVVGIRPATTSTTISTKGVIPLSHTRDTVGPMANSVTLTTRIYHVLQGTISSSGNINGDSDICLNTYSVNSLVQKHLKAALLLDLFLPNNEISSIALKYLDTRGIINALRHQWHIGLHKITTNIDGLKPEELKKHKSTSYYEFKTDFEQFFQGKFSLSAALDFVKQGCHDINGGCDAIITDLQKKVDATETQIPKSLRDVWRNLEQDIDKAMIANEIDVWIFPAFTNIANLVSSKKQRFCTNNRLAASIGYPSIVVPLGFVIVESGSSENGSSSSGSGGARLPYGIEIMSKPGKECAAFYVAQALEVIRGIKY
jgi:amidase